MPRNKGTKNKKVRSDKGKKHIKTIEQVTTAPAALAQEGQNATRDTSANATDATATGSATPDTAAE